MDDAFAVKTSGIKYLNLEICLLFALPPIKISGYAPVHKTMWRPEDGATCK